MAARIDLNTHTIPVPQGAPQGALPDLNLASVRNALDGMDLTTGCHNIFSMLSDGSLGQFQNRAMAVVDLKARALRSARMYPEELINEIEPFDFNDSNLNHIYDVARQTLEKRQARHNQGGSSFVTILKDRTLATFDPTKMTQGAAVAILFAAQFFREARETNDDRWDDVYMPVAGLSLGFACMTAINGVAAAIQNHNRNRVAPN